MPVTISSVVQSLHRDFKNMSIHLASQRQLFADTQRLLKEHAAWLKPGDWTPLPPKNKVWHHTHATPPPTLIGKGGKAPAVGANEAKSSLTVMLHRSWRRLWLATFAIAVRLRCIPRKAEVPNIVDRKGNAATIVRAALVHRQVGRASLIALEPELFRAVRLAAHGAYGDEYVAVRRKVSRYLRAPDFSIEGNGAVLVEDWCEGQVLHGLSVDLQLRVAVDVLDCYADLLAHETINDAGTAWKVLPQLLDEIRLPESLAEPLGDPCVRNLITLGKLAPCQGDLWYNILWDGSTSTWQLVDFDSAGWYPVWWDPVVLVDKTRATLSRNEDPQLTAVISSLNRIWSVAVGVDLEGMGLSSLMALRAVRKAWLESTNYQPSVGMNNFVAPDAEVFTRHLKEAASELKYEESG